MGTYVLWMNIAEGLLVALGFGYLLLSKRLGDSTPSLVKLFGRLCWGGFFIFFGATGLLPILFSPRVEVTGQVYELRRVNAGRGSYYFEFNVAGHDSRPALEADYSDPGFSSGDPNISDGDTVKVTYLEMNGKAVQIREVVGRHPGWEYRADTKPVALPILILIGLAFVVGAVAAFITDIKARPDNGSGEPKPIFGVGPVTLGSATLHMLSS